MAQGRKTNIKINQSKYEKDKLESWQRSTSISFGLARLTQIILLLASGCSILVKFHFTPVHCSWMNQVEQWFSILQRKRFRIIDFASKKDLRIKLNKFIENWNQNARPFNWTKKISGKGHG